MVPISRAHPYTPPPPEKLLSHFSPPRTLSPTALTRTVQREEDIKRSETLTKIGNFCDEDFPNFQVSGRLIFYHHWC